MSQAVINNEFYHTLGDAWWTADDHMITFLRYESVIKLDYLQKKLPPPPATLVDLGAGAGLVAIPLAQAGYRVIAVDVSAASLAVLMNRATQLEVADRIETVVADITQSLPIKEPVDAVLAMDVLEHVSSPAKVVESAAALLKPGGVFAYHTLNQTWQTWLLYLQIAPRLIRHGPKDLHLHHYNIKPAWMTQWVKASGLTPTEQQGIHAPFCQKANWELITRRRVKTPLRFEYTNSLVFGYLGMAEKPEG